MGEPASLTEWVDEFVTVLDDLGRVHTGLRVERDRLVSDRAALRERCEALEAVARQALEHVEELEEAWRGGVISELDALGRGGTRSNRNHDVAMALAVALAAHEPQEPQP